jgi:hypothetical protein
MRLIRARLERLEEQSTENDALAELASVFGYPVGALTQTPPETARAYLKALREFGERWEEREVIA